MNIWMREGFGGGNAWQAGKQRLDWIRRWGCKFVSAELKMEAGDRMDGRGRRLGWRGWPKRLLSQRRALALSYALAGRIQGRSSGFYDEGSVPNGGQMRI
jgi:hypothetical protein